MKKILLVLLILLTSQAFSQNEKKKNKKSEIKYEEIIAEKACDCLSKLDAITNVNDSITKCIIESKSKVHQENTQNNYEIDYTVEGIRKLHKNVTQMLIANCSIISKKEE